MNRDKMVREVIQEYLAMAKRQGDAHPEPDELVAYHEGGLAAEDERRVQDHLLGCRECAALLADYDGLTDPDFGSDEDIPESAVEAIWGKVREEIRKDPQSSRQASNVVSFKTREARRAEARRWLQSLAAALLITTVALSAWVANLRDQVKELKELSSPQANALVLDLYPAGSTQRGGEGPDIPTVRDRLFTMLLHPAGSSPFDSYEAEIVDGRGEKVLTKPGVKYDPESDSFLPFPLSRDLLGPGDFQIRLVGIGPGGERKTVASYAFRIAGP